MLFFRTNTDKTQLDCTAVFRNAYAGTQPSACWIIGAGPSLKSLPVPSLEAIQQSPAGRMAVNMAGRGDDGAGWLLKPTHWTCYDQTARFSRSVFNDPSITKFVRASRATDLIPDGTEKICDCPSTYFVESEFRKYGTFVDPHANAVNDSLDSFVQAVDIAFLLGFRELYLIGTEMRICPSKAQIALAESHDVTYPVVMPDKRVSDRLLHFAEAFADKRGIELKNACAELEAVDREDQYAFPEWKPFSDAVRCDTHYYDRVQYLRLARKTFAMNGLRIVSCTPGSRLNHWFPFEAVEDVCARLLSQHGDPKAEPCEGRYTRPQPVRLPWHNDLRPFFKAPERKEPKRSVAKQVQGMIGLEVKG